MDEIEFSRRVDEAIARKAARRAYLKAMRQVFGPPWLYLFGIAVMSWPVVLMVKEMMHHAH